MKVKRVVLDVDKGPHAPSVLELAIAIDSVPSVEAFDITVTGIDPDSVGLDIAAKGAANDCGSAHSRSVSGRQGRR